MIIIIIIIIITLLQFQIDLAFLLIWNTIYKQFIVT